MSPSHTVDHLLLGDHSTEAILPATDIGRQRSTLLPPLDWRQVVGALLIITGLAAVLAGWWGASGTASTKDQLSYIASGGVGGAALIALGLIFMVMYEHLQDRAALTDLAHRLVAIEEGMGSEFNQLYRLIDQGGPRISGTAR